MSAARSRLAAMTAPKILPGSGVKPRGARPWQHNLRRTPVLGIFALVLFLAGGVLAAVQRNWVLALLAAGLACWLFDTGAGLLP